MIYLKLFELSQLVVEFDDIDTFKLQVLILQPKAGSWELRKHDEERRMVPKNKHSQVAYLPAMHCNLVALFLSRKLGTPQT